MGSVVATVGAFCWPWAFGCQRPTTTANCAVIVASPLGYQRLPRVGDAVVQMETAPDPMPGQFILKYQAAPVREIVMLGRKLPGKRKRLGKTKRAQKILAGDADASFGRTAEASGKPNVKPPSATKAWPVI